MIFIFCPEFENLRICFLESYVEFKEISDENLKNPPKFIFPSKHLKRTKIL